MLTEGFFRALTSLLKGGTLFPGNFFIAVGTGEEEWDDLSPPYDRAMTTLVREISRKSVSPEDIVFLDAGGEEILGPSSRLRVRTTFEHDEAVGTLRECGLFGGDATLDQNTGTLLTYYIHPRLGKTADMTLQRSLRIDLTPQPFVPGSRMTRYAGNVRTLEFHDLENLTPACQFEEIRFDRRVFLSNIEQATSLGYDFCAHCFDPELSQR